MKTQLRKISRSFRLVVLFLASAFSTQIYSQIIYTDVVPDMTHSEIPIDMDNDGSVEFVVATYNSWGYYAAAGSLSDQAILSYNYCNTNFAMAISSGDIIGPNQDSWHPNYVQLAGEYYDFCEPGHYELYGPWLDTEAYLGLRFNINGNTHYGWARLSMTFEQLSTLMEYAYNSIPDARIYAGQTVLGVEESILEEIKVIVLNRQISIFNLPHPMAFNLYAIHGQKLLHGNLEKSDTNVDVQNLTSGVYIIELISHDSAFTIKKKIVIR